VAVCGKRSVHGRLSPNSMPVTADRQHRVRLVLHCPNAAQNDD
jgi:hypothetical protein